MQGSESSKRVKRVIKTASKDIAATVKLDLKKKFREAAKIIEK